MPATSHRVSFERWLRKLTGYSIKDIRTQRSEFGYQHQNWDLAFSAYKAGVMVERGRQKDRTHKNSRRKLHD